MQPSSLLVCSLLAVRGYLKGKAVLDRVAELVRLCPVTYSEHKLSIADLLPEETMVRNKRCIIYKILGVLIAITEAEDGECREDLYQ